MLQTCNHCGHTNPEGKKFCTQCGHPLTRRCPSCGAEVSSDDRFCGECGATIAAVTAGPKPSQHPSAAPSIASAAPSPAHSSAVASCCELRQFHGHTSSVMSIAVSPDGQYALSGDDRGGLRFWDLSSGQQRFQLSGHKAEVLSVAFSPDGRLALSAAGFLDKTIRVWDVAGGRETGSIAGHTGGVTAAIFSPDGKSILSGSEDNTVRIWDVASRFEMVRLLGHTGKILAVGYAVAGRRVVSAANDMTIRVWDPEADRELQCIQMEAVYRDLTFACAFSPDGLFALSTDPEGVQVWDLRAGTKLRTLTGHGGNIFGAAFSLDGSRALTCAGTDYYDDKLREELGGVDNTARLWDLGTGRELARMVGHTRNVNCVSFTPDGRRALTGSSDATVRLWDLPA